MEESLVAILQRAAWMEPVTKPWVLETFGVSRNTAAGWLGEVMERWPTHLERVGHEIRFRRGEALPPEASAETFASLYFSFRKYSLVSPSVLAVFLPEVLETLLTARRDGLMVEATWVNPTTLQIERGLLSPRFFTIGLMGAAVCSQAPKEDGLVLPLAFMSSAHLTKTKMNFLPAASLGRNHYVVQFSPDLDELQKAAFCRLLGLPDPTKTLFVALDTEEYRRIGLILSSFGQGVPPLVIWPTV